MEAEQRGSGR